MKALLDEQLSRQIAVLLRQVGLDVEAVADRPDLAGRSDMVIFEVACREDRAVITNNIKDFRPLAAQWLAQGRVHGGLILLPSARTRTRAATTMLAGVNFSAASMAPMSSRITNSKTRITSTWAMMPAQLTNWTTVKTICNIYEPVPRAAKCRRCL